ncbi:MAG: 3-hydroxyacyl-CoA dehydrogenase family protein [Firmicutes bacterium]|nr:3-hydroxyacyl-CoA dehydrogenase family protein [Bacillota bacterium]
MDQTGLHCIKNIAVIGAGIMGPGIAQVFAAGGYQVKIWEPEEMNRAVAARRIMDGLKLFETQGTISSKEAGDTFERIEFSQSLEEAVQDVELIMEAIVEKEDVKRTFYKELAELIDEKVIVASNTSAMNIFEIVPPKLLLQQLIVHWYSPAQLVPLVEVVKSDEAPQAMADAVIRLLKDCGKAPIQMKKFIRGYVINRLQQCLNREIFFLLDNGYCTAEDIDYAAKMSFIPRAMVLGLCKKIDFGGVDTTINNFKNHSYTLPPDTELPETLKKMEKDEAFGIKSGKGFYDYSNVDMSDLLEKRDRQLVEAYRLALNLIEDPV